MLHAGGDYQHYDAASQRGQPRYDREGYLPPFTLKLATRRTATGGRSG